MAKVSPLIGRFLTGAAETAAPFVMADHKAKIDAARDARLRAYEVEDRTANQAFTDDQRRKTETFTDTQRRAGETFQSGESSLDRKSRESYQDAQLALARDQLGLQEAQYDMTFANHMLQQSESIANTEYRAKAQDLAERTLKINEEGAKITTAIQQLNLDRATDQKKFLDLLGDPKISEEQRNAARDYLIYSGAYRPQYRSGVDVNGEFQMWMDGQLVSGDGVTPFSSGGGAGGGGAYTTSSPAEPQTQADYDALPSGAVFRDPDTNELMRKP